MGNCVRYSVSDVRSDVSARIRAIPIIRTKLHRPPVAKDVVCREALHDRLDERGHQPLILVSAPAGYGKSTFVSHWLETRACPSAWLTLDQTDGDLTTFLSYVVASVRTVFPEACRETLVQLEADTLAPLPILAGFLNNDFDELEKPLVLVLDDYHRIEEPAVHELVNHLLKHPPSRLQLVIISRYDPPLSLGALRAHNGVTEIRVRDLMFTLSETGTFLEQATGKKVSSSAIEHLHQSTEGWVAGLRLAALAVRHRGDTEAFLRGIGPNVRDVQDYLVQEVLSQQLPAAVDCLCRTAILNRFCAPLCEVVGANQGDKDTDHINGSAFIRLLEDSGLFSVALDESGEWYRYHHLFQKLLQSQLEARHTPDEIADLHRRAAAWFEAQGFLEEAVHHTLHADGAAEAGHLIVRHRNDILNREQWHRLDRWLHQLPEKTIEEDPELMMLQAWRRKNQGRYSEAFSILDRIEEIIGPGPWSPTTERLRGGVDALRSWQRYQEGEGVLSIRHADQALLRLSPDCLSERATACFFLGGARQMSGDLEGARKLISELITDPSSSLGTFQARLEMTLCFIDWVAADLPSLRLAADRMLQLGEALGLKESVAIANYFLGIVNYHENQLSAADSSLVQVVTSRRVPNLEYYTESVFALASVHQARGQADKASETVASVCEQLLGTGNTALLQRAQAYEADLALRQGRIAAALEWAQRFNVEPLEANVRFQEPRFSLAKILIAEGGTTNLERAAALLQRMEAFVTRIHSTRLLIEALALKALLCDAQGDESIARDSLARAIHLAMPGGFIRLFVDLGPALARLLNGLDLETRELHYVGRILSAFSGDGMTKTIEALDQPLTKREVEILGLLADELSNKQISDQLCISPATVKRHSENIYQKLGVHGRRQAVSKALGLSIVRSGLRVGPPS